VISTCSRRGGPTEGVVVVSDVDVAGIDDATAAVVAETDVAAPPSPDPDAHPASTKHAAAHRLINRIGGEYRFPEVVSSALCVVLYLAGNPRGARRLVAHASPLVKGSRKLDLEQGFLRVGLIGRLSHLDVPGRGAD
jgi:hypothetical protein